MWRSLETARFVVDRGSCSCSCSWRGGCWGEGGVVVGWRWVVVLLVVGVVVVGVVVVGMVVVEGVGR